MSPPTDIFTYGITNIHDSDIRYAREKRVKIKLVAQVVKVSPLTFTMFVMPEFVSPSRYIYSVDDEYNGVVIRGECYDRQFMFGKGAGSLPTASSILSDVRPGSTTTGMNTKKWPIPTGRSIRQI